MALQKRVVLSNGIELNEAYLKVSEIRYSVVSERVRIGLCLYKDRQSRLDGKNPVEVKWYDTARLLSTGGMLPIYDDTFAFAQYFTPDAMDRDGNIVQQAYRYLKSLPEFQDSKDV